MALEQQGVPSIAVHTDAFARLAKSTARANGMPTTRQAYVPQPLVDRSPEQLRAYIEGPDPINKKPFMQILLEGLTGELDDNDRKGLSFERDTPRFLEADTEDNLNQLFQDNYWTDFMPIVMPTEERVEAMLKGTSHPRDKVVGRLSPTNFREDWEFTVEKVAVNAVMAGCKPEYLPVVLAMTSCGMTSLSSSTTSFAGLAVVNGPIRRELGMNTGIGVMGPYDHASVSIGRAWNLCSRNLQGGSTPGDTYMGSLGNWYAVASCFAENEEASPWTPLHTQYGFKPEESAVTTFRGGRYMQSGFGPRVEWQNKFRAAFAATAPRQSPLIVMDPIVARGLIEKGLTTKDDFIDWCVDNAQQRAADYWNDQWVQTLVHPLAVAGVEPWATNLKAAPDDMLKMFSKDEINVVVTGGETQGNWRIYEGKRMKNNTVSIDKWR